MNKKAKTSELFENIPSIIDPLFSRCEYPWQILPLIRDFVSLLIKDGLEGYSLLSEGVLIGEDVKIYPGTYIEGPTIIGSGCEIRPGAFIRGSVFIGSGCVIGNSCEVKNSVILDKAQIPHYNYIGDSILGFCAHTGAGTVLSNLKSDQKNVVIHFESGLPTNLRKVGSFLGDFADIGCGCVLNPGTVIGKRTSVYPLTSLRGVYPENSIVKGTFDIVKRI